MVSSLPDLPPPLSFITIIAILIVYVLCCYLIINFISHHEEDYVAAGEDSHWINHSSYSHISIEELQQITCLYPRAGSNCLTCAICLENLEHFEVCRILPDCHHEFHAQCIDPWLSKRLTCPVCRAPFRFRQVRGVLGDLVTVN